MTQVARHKIAVISGGGTGIGLATARLLLAEGYKVTAIGIEAETELPAGLEFVKIDVTDDEAIENFAGRFKRLDALINAAGMIAHNRGEFDMKGFRRVVDVNLNGTAACCFAFKDALTAARGAIVASYPRAEVVVDHPDHRALRPAHRDNPGVASHAPAGAATQAKYETAGGDLHHHRVIHVRRAGVVFGNPPWTLLR